jgi:hypothetical protein
MKTIIKTIIKLLSKSRKRYCKTLKRKQKAEERIAWLWIIKLEDNFKTCHLLSTKKVFLKKVHMPGRIL